MADQAQLNRITRFFGGITINDKDNANGVALNVEEIDIFSNTDFIRPNTIFEPDSVITRKITGYTIGDLNDITVGGTLYGLGRDASGTPKAEIWRKTSADSTSPSAWSSVKTSAFDSNAQSPIKWHRVTVKAATVNPITRSGSTATLTTAFGHGLTTSNVVAITVNGADQVEYNGTFKGTVASSTTITYTVSGTPATPATTLLAGGITVSYAFLYYVTGTQQLTKAEITDSTSPAAFSESTTEIVNAAGTADAMILSGLGLSDDRIPMERYNGELFIGHGRFVAKVATDGVVTTYAFTLPAGWRAISFTPFSRNLAILARSDSSGGNECKIFYWDTTDTTGAVDETVITMGGPQIVINFNEILWALCAIAGRLNIYRIEDKRPALTHSLLDVALETDTQAVIPDATKFVKQNAFYFGLNKTDKTGLYAIGQTETGRPYALVLAKRFQNPTVSSITNATTTATLTTSTSHGLAINDSVIVTGANEGAYNGVFTVLSVTSTTFTYLMLSDPSGSATGSPTTTTNSYSTHSPQASIAVGDNYYTGFDNNGTASVAKGEGASQTRSSNAIYETILIDLGSPELPKTWLGYLLGARPLPNNCQIVTDARTDNETDYDTRSVFALTNANDQSRTTEGVTADTVWYRDWISLYGRLLQTRLRFISSGTSTATMYYVSLISRDGVVF